MTPKERSAKDLINELLGKKCRCGAMKRPRMTFCAKCYFSLTKDLQTAIWRRIGDGYELAYEKASTLLDAKQTTEGNL